MNSLLSYSLGSLVLPNFSLFRFALFRPLSRGDLFILSPFFPFVNPFFPLLSFLYFISPFFVLFGQVVEDNSKSGADLIPYTAFSLLISLYLLSLIILTVSAIRSAAFCFLSNVTAKYGFAPSKNLILFL